MGVMTIHHLADHRPTETTAARERGASAGTKIVITVAVLFVFAPVFLLTWLDAPAVVGAIGVICQLVAIAVFIHAFRSAMGADS